MKYSTFDGKSSTLKTGGGKPLLINLWASWCAPCVEELKEFTHREKDLRGRGLEIVALSVDGLGDDRSDPAAAQALMKKIGFPFLAGRATSRLLDHLQYVHNVLMPMWRPLPVPTSFLVDGQGRLQAIYKGRVEVDTLLNDLGHSKLSRRERLTQSSPIGGLAIDHEMVERGALVGETQIRFRFANFLRRAERLDDAIRQYRDITQLMPDFSEAHANLGHTLMTVGDFKAAGTRFQAALRLDPKNADTRNNLGRVYLKLQRPTEARSAFEEALRLTPDFVDAHNNLGITLATLGDLKAAKAQFQATLRRYPSYPDAHNNLGRICLQQYQLAEARSAFEEALRLNSDFVDAHNNLGITLVELGNLKAAKVQFQAALRANPDYPGARANLERVQKMLEK